MSEQGCEKNLDGDTSEDATLPQPLLVLVYIPVVRYQPTGGERLQVKIHVSLA
jgi:hypothetical protein